jgi:hypothetical protein
LIGALAVLATLVYLAAQTRQTRIAAEETAKFAALQATHSIIDIYAGWRQTLLSNPEHTEILAKANSGAVLSPSEQITVSMLFHDLFYGASYSHSSALSAGSIHEAPADVEYTVLMLRDMPCALVEWQRLKHNVARMSPEFVEHVDKELEARSSDTNR